MKPRKKELIEMLTETIDILVLICYQCGHAKKRKNSNELYCKIPNSCRRGAIIEKAMQINEIKQNLT